MNDHVATFVEPEKLSPITAARYLRDKGWNLKEAWPLTRAMAQLMADHPGIFDRGSMESVLIVDTTGQGEPVLTKDIVAALRFGS